MQSFELFSTQTLQQLCDTRSCGERDRKGISTDTSTHARTQNNGMVSVSYDTLCKVVVRSAIFFNCAASPAAAADVRENGIEAPPHSSTRHGRGAHDLSPAVPQKDSAGQLAHEVLPAISLTPEEILCLL